MPAKGRSGLSSPFGPPVPAVGLICEETGHERDSQIRRAAQRHDGTDRGLALSDPGQGPVRVYDPSGPYTESNAAIALADGLPSVREAWIEARGFAPAEPRAIKPEDNGNVSADHLAPLCP